MSWFNCLFPWCARSWRAVEVEAEGDLFRDTCCDARRSSGRRGCGPVTTGRGPLEFCAESGFDSGGMLFGSCGEVGDTAAADLYSYGYEAPRRTVSISRIYGRIGCAPPQRAE